MRPFFSFTLIFSLFMGSFAHSAQLSLDAYIAQVEGKNQNVAAAKKTTAGAELSVGEADLIFMPNLFAQTQFTDNYFRNATFPEAYASYFNDTYQVGVSEVTPYGVSASLSYLLSHQGFLGAVDFVSGQVSDRRFWEGTPQLQVTVSLWRNWLGGETKATQAVTRASTLVNEYSSSYQVRATRAEAENAYVRLVSAQQLVQLYQDSLAQANDIFRWNDKRMRVNLGESSDLLQAKANVESSKLLLQSSQDDLRVASRDFNRYRNIDSDTVEETLVLPSIENVSVPARGEIRDDVRAAQENAHLAAAQAKLGQERNRPTLEAFGTVALNDRETAADSTFTHSFMLGQQTTAFGVRLNMPLAFGTRSDVVRGYEMEREGADTLVAQKLFEQEVEWKDLSQQLNEAKRRYDIAASLSKIQKQKVESERVRLKRGRTTTYQTLIFNIDFNSAEAARIQAQGTVLSILARMKTFGEGRI